MGRAGSALLILGLILVGVLVVPGLFRPPREGQLVFAQESADLGQVPLNQKVPFRFEMRNIGDEPVAIVGKAKIRAVEGC